MAKNEIEIVISVEGREALMEAIVPGFTDRRSRDLHIVAKSEYPVALCGYVVRDEFNPNRADTAGRDRCAECLRLFAKLRGGSGA